MILTDFLSGSQNPRALWETYKYKKKFRLEHPDYFEPDGIMVFCGPQGSGKTLSAVSYVKKVLSRFPKCILCTNIEIHGLPDYVQVVRYQGPESFSCVNNGEKGVIFLVDEIHLEFNSLESKNIDVSVMTEIAQQRKQRKHIVGTSQVYGRVAKPFREQYRWVVSCTKILGCIQYNQLIDGNRTVERSDGTLETQNVRRFIWFHTPALYGSYDTYAKVLRTHDYQQPNFRRGGKR